MRGNLGIQHRARNRHIAGSILMLWNPEPMGGERIEDAVDVECDESVCSQQLRV